MDDARALFANAAFYHAVSAGDLEALGDLWALQAPVCCIHPGWPVLHGREAVLDSWSHILDGPAPPDIQPHHARSLRWGELHAVTCYEALGGQMLSALNLFVEERGALRLVHHQAGQCAQPPAPEQQGPVQ